MIEKGKGDVGFSRSPTLQGVSSSVQEKIEYAMGMMVKRLPDKTTEDAFVHDLKFKGLSDVEAREVFGKLTNEGVLAYDPEGWVVRRMMFLKEKPRANDSKTPVQRMTETCRSP